MGKPRSRNFARQRLSARLANRIRFELGLGISIQQVARNYRISRTAVRSVIFKGADARYGPPPACQVFWVLGEGVGAVLFGLEK